MRHRSRALLIGLTLLSCSGNAMADDEASNVPHVAVGPYGRCYAKSVSAHTYDPVDEPRQQGRTMVYRVGNNADALVQTLNWFSQSILLGCGPAADIVVVRLGPWQRGRAPRADHLAIAFYRGARLVKRYSTLDIAGDESYKNVSVSASHYTVFQSAPKMDMVEDQWVVSAKTVDGRLLTFDMATGELSPKR